MRLNWAALAVSGLGFWLFRIYQVLPLLAVVVIACEVALYFLISFPKSVHLKSVFIVSLAIILLFQFRTTNRTPLTTLSNDEQHIQKTRMIDEYPLVRISLGPKTLWIPAAHWLEERKEAIAFWKIWKNAGQTVDINLYFFGNHPRSRVGIVEFEKLPYILLPFFLIGTLSVGWKRNWKIYLVGFLLPFGLTSLWGHQTPLGPIGLAPILFTATARGIYKFFQKLSSIKPIYRNLIYVVSGIAFILVVIQLVSYTKY